VLHVWPTHLFHAEPLGRFKKLGNAVLEALLQHRRLLNRTMPPMGRLDSDPHLLAVVIDGQGGVEVEL
jgi:hypothetical protein